MPADYNENRAGELPIPRIRPDNFDAVALVNQFPNLEQPFHEINQNEPQPIEEIMLNELAYKEIEPNDEVEVDAHEQIEQNAHQAEEDDKFNLLEVNISDIDAQAVAGLFQPATNASVENVVVNSVPEEIEPIASTSGLNNRRAKAITFIDSDGKLKVNELFDGDCEIIYTIGEKLIAMPPLYQTKQNDIISENIPFREYVSASLLCLFFLL